MAADPAELIGHVKDADYFHVPQLLAFHYDGLQWRFESGSRTFEFVLAKFDGTHYYCPRLEIFDNQLQNLVFQFQVTKFMVLELVAMFMILVIFLPLARRIATGQRPRGKLWNFFETFLLFLRDEVARPAIGKKDADRFLPFIWTIFFFILFCNLLGMIPWAGSPTGAMGVTLALALMTFGTVVGAGTKRYGLVGFWTGQVPHMELPLVLAVLIKPMIFGIEVMGMLVKHFILAVRLLANMFAGHLVLAVILGFIAATAHLHVGTWAGVTAASIFGATALSMLELFVAFLQAYIFAFLSALFIGMAIHQH